MLFISYELPDFQKGEALFVNDIIHCECKKAYNNSVHNIMIIIKQ